MASSRDMDPLNGDRVRPLQVSSLLRRVIQERLARGLSDPRYRGLVSVTEVKVGSDLRTAVVLVSVLPEKYGSRVLHALKSATSLLRRQIRSETALRRVPELEFRLDDSIKRDAQIAESIREHNTEDDDIDADSHDGDDEEEDILDLDEIVDEEEDGVYATEIDVNSDDEDFLDAIEVDDED